MKKVLISKLTVLLLLGTMSASIAMPTVEAVATPNNPTNVIYQMEENLAEYESSLSESNINIEKLQVQELEQELDTLIEAEGTGEGRAFITSAMLITAAKWLAGFVGGYIASKLVDWGAKKWCATYKYTNWATKAVCNFLGY